jgi:prolyl oligopeptidase
MGGSNGGLLVGATFTERPELFHAVVCQVPLLDMLRYTRIAAGPSWIGEYGDPADPAMAEAIRKYSPYQNVRADAGYPSVFFLTSTKDDRVGPVHARKMAARLEAAGYKPLYWENVEGGHGAAADLEERVKMRSLQFTYLLRTLAD